MQGDLIGTSRNALVAVVDLLERSCPDLNFTELRIFLAVAEQEGLSVSSIARICRLSDGTASRTIRRLAAAGTPGVIAPARGLLELARDPGDNRSRFVFLTAQGRVLCDTIDRIVSASGRVPLIKGVLPPV